MLLGNLWAPDGEVLRLIPIPEADGSAELAFRGRGGGGRPDRTSTMVDR